MRHWQLVGALCANVAAVVLSAAASSGQVPPALDASALADFGRSVLYNGGVYYWYDDAFYYPDGRRCPPGYPPVAPPSAVVARPVVVDANGAPLPAGPALGQLPAAVPMPADVTVSVAGTEHEQRAGSGPAVAAAAAFSPYQYQVQQPGWPYAAYYQGGRQPFQAFQYHPSYYGYYQQRPQQLAASTWWPYGRYYGGYGGGYRPAAATAAYSPYGYPYGYGHGNAIQHRNPYWRFPWLKRVKKEKADKKE